MSSQVRVACTGRSDRAESAAALAAATQLWLAQRWASETAAPASQGIEQADGADGSVIVRVLGDLDLCSCPELQSVLAGLLRTRRPTILELSAIRFIDCPGLGVVLWATNAAQADDWSFVVAPERAPCVTRLIVLTGVGSALSHAQMTTEPQSSSLDGVEGATPAVDPWPTTPQTGQWL
jgi:anti-anti-sigma factor